MLHKAQTELCGLLFLCVLVVGRNGGGVALDRVFMALASQSNSRSPIIAQVFCVVSPSKAMTETSFCISLLGMSTGTHPSLH